MKKIIFTSFVLLFLYSCSTKKQIQYLNDLEVNEIKKNNFSLKINNIEPGDILKIDVSSIVPEAVAPFNKTVLDLPSENINMLKLSGYLVDDSSNINYPVLGTINTYGLNTRELELKITKLLVDEDYLSNPSVKVNRVNSKFTILGEVKQAGTFSYF